MTDDTETVEVDGTEVEVAQDPANARMVAVSMTVSADEKVSTGQYESFDAYQSQRVNIDPALDLTDPDARQRLGAMAEQLHMDIQDDLDHAIDQRLSEPGFEEWDADPRRPEENDD